MEFHTDTPPELLSIEIEDAREIIQRVRAVVKTTMRYATGEWDKKLTFWLNVWIGMPGKDRDDEPAAWKIVFSNLEDHPDKEVLTKEILTGVAEKVATYLESKGCLITTDHETSGLKQIETFLHRRKSGNLTE